MCYVQNSKRNTEGLPNKYTHMYSTNGTFSQRHCRMIPRLLAQNTINVASGWGLEQSVRQDKHYWSYTLLPLLFPSIEKKKCKNHLEITLSLTFHAISHFVANAHPYTRFCWKSTLVHTCLTESIYFHKLWTVNVVFT